MKTNRTSTPVLSRIEKRLALFAAIFGLPVLATPAGSPGSIPSRRRRK